MLKNSGPRRMECSTEVLEWVSLYYFSSMNGWSPSLFMGRASSIDQLNTNIREYGSTLYVGLARAVSPTDTNFR